jgi:4-alpha-glucanotransferase
MMSATDRLRQAARLYGVLPDYEDVQHRKQYASREALVRLLQILGAPLAGEDDLPEVLRAGRAAIWQRPIEPVLVAWDGRLAVPLRLPAASGGRVSVSLVLENGETRAWSRRGQDLAILRTQTVEGVAYVARELALPWPLPRGYHELVVECGKIRATAMVISAPRLAYAERRDGPRPWGVFLPLHALGRQSSWGAGDFSDLAALMDWIAQHEGHLVATLPILAAVDIAKDPSPYAPTSRFFWNEFYLDLAQIPELPRCPKAQRLLGSIAAEDEIRRLRRARLVDYGRQMGLKRRVLERLSEAFAAGPAKRRAALAEYCREHPAALSYARFRATLERRREDFFRWPDRLRRGLFRGGDFDESVARYHLYAQWQTEEQLRAAVRRADALELRWYFDYPLGVSRNGFDVWREPELFALDAFSGAPPDEFFTQGQNWDFPPLHPERLRETRYRYFIAALRRHLCYAKVLRVDHVMGLHRLYWIPSGMAATDGAYVRYRMDELMAILVLESHRHRATIVGENLGTVPPEVDRAIARHGLCGMYVLQYELQPDRRRPLRPIRRADAASLNTHDMATFRSFLEGRDADDRVKLGLIDAREADRARKKRARQRQALVRLLRRKGLLAAGADDPASITEASLMLLAASRAGTLLVSLEDLWGETRQQNTPGTGPRQRPNWRRRSRYRLEEIIRNKTVAKILARISERRK